MTTPRFNPSQQQAIEHDTGPLIVLAGPGTGKTSVIVHRVAHMINARDIDPSRILALTFTNEAARELRERLSSIVPPAAADRLNASTFHSFGLSLLRRFSDLAGLSAQPTLLDSAQLRRLLRHLIQEHGLFRSAIAGGIESLIEESRTIIAELRNNAVDPQHCLARIETLRQRADLDEGARASIERFAEHARLFALLDAACIARGLLSIDELLTRPIALLRTHRIAREICQHDYMHTLVDEFQDLNIAQMRLLMELCPSNRPRLDLCVVGDDDQAIYAFRGANQFAFAHFAAHWKNARTICLTQNYRSAAPVIAVGNAIIAASNTRFAPDKHIEPANPARQVPSACVEAITLASDFDADPIIATMILADRARHADRAWNSYAVICRTHGDIERIASALRLEDIPVRVRASASPLEDEGVQDLFAWIRLTLDPNLAWAARRILLRPPFGLVAETVAQWERAYAAAMSRRSPWQAEPFIAFVQRSLDPADAAQTHLARATALLAAFASSASTESADTTIERIVLEADLTGADLVGGRQRIQRIEALVAVLRFVRDRLGRLEQPRDLAAFWSYYNDLDAAEQNFGGTLDQRVDPAGPASAEPEDDAVSLLTAHSAKGLEFDTVFIPRITPPHGYPLTSRKRESPLPPDLLPADSEALGLAASSLLEEERRLFYVACTRAERRLVLLAKLPNKPGATNLFFPLVSSGLCFQRSPDHIIDDASTVGVSSRLWQDSGVSSPRALSRKDRATLLATARARLRLEAALVLDAADTPTPDDLDALATRLRSIVARLHAISAAEAAVDVRDTHPDALSQHAHLIEQLAAQSAIDSSPSTLNPPRPPLTLSYTAIRDYQRCPRCYYLRHVMRLSEPESAAASVGQIAHKALERFYRRWMDADAEGRTLPTLDDLLSLAHQTFDLFFPEHKPIDLAQRDQILAALTTTFDTLHDATAQPIELEKDVSFAFDHAGIAHRLIAKLDRIDRTAAGLRIIDYKTGFASKPLLEPPADDLQFGIYALALAHLYGSDALAGTAEYWLLASAQKGVLRLQDINLDAVQNTIASTIDNILAGNFTRTDCTCSGACAILDAVSRDHASA